jgi:hypothetical protein
MLKLKKLALIAALSVTFTGTIYADDSCAPIPGQMNTPPCSLAQSTTDEEGLSAPTDMTPATNDVTVYSVTEITLSVIENLLTLV